VGKRMQGPTKTQPTVIVGPFPEEFLSSRDNVLAKIILCQSDRWHDSPDPDPIRGLIRVVISQQISTKAALTIQTKVASSYPQGLPDSISRLTTEKLRSCGLSPRKAKCCASIAANAKEISRQIQLNENWERTLLKISGIGPWTLAIFRIFVLREPDILPEGDLGLARAITMHYPGRELKSVSDVWRPYRSIACWYLWRSLGNPPLG
jgi:DNA-3-methyladenine glycosylase II